MMKLAKSYVHGTSPTPLIGETIGVNLERARLRWPGNEAVVVCHQGVRWTYEDLNREADGLAAGLLALGLEPGERVGVWSPNKAEWIAAQFATAKAGLVLVNINPAYRLAELEYALNKVDCAALVMADRFKTSDYIAMLRDLVPELDGARPGELQAERVPSLKSVIRLGRDRTAGMFNLSEVAVSGGEAERRRRAGLAETLQFDDPINIQFTSGTTGTPKATALTHFPRPTGSASRCPCTTASAWSWAACSASPMGPPWSSPRPASMPGQRLRPSPSSAARRCTACPPCS
jgi:fatty-acyl-CoA synthase